MVLKNIADVVHKITALSFYIFAARVVLKARSYMSASFRTWSMRAID